MEKKERKRPFRKSISPRQAKFCHHHFVEGKSKAEAARLAGYSENCATQNSHHILKSPQVQQWIEKNLSNENWYRTMHDTVYKVMTTGRKDADKLRSVEIWARLVGAYKPDKQEVEVFTREEREEEYRNIISMVRSGDAYVVDTEEGKMNVNDPNTPSIDDNQSVDDKGDLSPIE